MIKIKLWFKSIVDEILALFAKQPEPIKEQLPELALTDVRRYDVMIEQALERAHIGEKDRDIIRGLTTTTLSGFLTAYNISENLSIQRIDFILNLMVETIKQINGDISKIAGVQPMPGPVAMVLGLRMVKSESALTSLEVISNPVEARSYTLLTKFTLELQHDLVSQHGSTATTEVIKLLAECLSSEIFNNVMNEIMKQTATTKELPKKVSPDKLSIAIAQEAINIAKDTGRGPGNVIIASQDIVGRLSLLPPPLEPHTNELTNIKLEGILNGIRVYTCKNYDIGNKILVGYKGNASSTDAGFIYAPYQAIAPSVTIDAETFQPLMGFKSRNGSNYKEGYYRVIEIAS